MAMKPVMPVEDIKGMEYDHNQSEKRPDECYACGQEWPCQVSLLLKDWRSWESACEAHRLRSEHWRHQAVVLGWKPEKKA
jgi:hypothetical protein